MKLILSPSTCRVSDNLVSKEYGARKCATHTPTPDRPGKISKAFTKGFDQHGYPLQTDLVAPPCLIEVYPHPALVNLAEAAERLPYKFSKIRKYWPDRSLNERKTLLLQEWARIVELLEDRIMGVRQALPIIPPNASGKEMKAYEDQLDAVICAWVGICALEGKASPFGDQISAIWIPNG